MSSFSNLLALFPTIDAQGFHINATQSDWNEELFLQYEAIYNKPFSRDKNTPLAQFIDLQSSLFYTLTLKWLLSYNAQNIMTAVGIQLDNIGINYGVLRLGGVFSEVEVDITVNATVSLAGLDGDFDNLNATAFALRDTGNGVWYLKNSTTLTAGTHTLSFRSAEYGAINVSPDNITNFITVLAGLVSCTNTNAPYIIGSLGETDPQYRARIIISVSQTGLGFDDALKAQLLQVQNVTDVVVDEATYEPLVWCIVEGGSETDIAKVIVDNSYSRNFAGDVVIIYNKPDGSQNTRRISRPIYQDLYLNFTLPTGTWDTNAIKNALVLNLTFKLQESVIFKKVYDTIAETLTELNYNPNGLAGVEFSDDDITYTTNPLNPTTIQHRFILDVANINITIL